MHSPPSTIALFPLHTVLFPGGLLPLQIFETRYVDLVRECLHTGTGFGVVPIKEGREAGVAAVPFLVGTFAEIADWSQGDNGLLNIMVRGTRRFRISSLRVAPNQLVMAEVEWVDLRAVAAPEQYAELRALLHKLLEHDDAIQQMPELHQLSTSQIAYRIASILPLSTADKSSLLGLNDDLVLLAAIESALSQVFARQSTRH